MSLDPIVHTYRLTCEPGHAFTTYADRIGEWWPARYTADPATLEDVVLEPGYDGRVFERYRSGEELDWGRVTVWEPDRRIAYTSTLAQPDEHPSLITVTFTAVVGGCEVVFEHGGWNERNGKYRDKFGDWPTILGGFVALADA
jgi:hypothetical protein